MAKFKLSPNAEVDVLTQAELEETLNRTRDEFLSGFSRPATDPYRDFQATRLDASGDSGMPGSAANPSIVKLFDVKAGYALRLHRLTVDAEGTTPFTLYAGGYLYLYRAGRLIDRRNLDVIADTFPILFEYTSDAPIYNNGESIDIFVKSGPASKTLICDIQGTLESLPGTLVFT